MSPPSTTAPPLQRIPLPYLSSSDPSIQRSVRAAIHAAFGPTGPGILLVDTLPSTFASHRTSLLQAAYQLPSIPPSDLAALECPHLHYAVGWSHGKETFDGQPDRSKASFYANPIHDDPSQANPSLVSQYPTYMHPNRWPAASTTASLEPNFKAIGHLAHNIALQLATHIDNLVNNLQPISSTSSSSPPSSFHSLLANSRSAKGRLLHYFPSHPLKSQPSPLWCGFHNDHGLLTALLCGQYYLPDGTSTKSPSGPSGLIIAPHTTNQQSVQSVPIQIPSDAIAFQVGETAQIITGGLLRATAHAVLAPTTPLQLARVTLAVFLQPDPWVQLHMPANASHDALVVSDRVPKLQTRFEDGLTFGEFAERTFAKYY